MSERYDVILFGIRGDGEDFEKSKLKIAKVLQLDVAKIDQALSNHVGLVIHCRVTLNTAKKLQAGLLKFGGLCNFRLAKNQTRRLDSVQLAVTDAKPMLVCPACDFRQEFDTEEDVPETCPNCSAACERGTTVQIHEEEQERINQRLLEMYEARELPELIGHEQRKAVARLVQLEEEIRKELALPRKTTSRSRNLSVAVALLLFGLAVGFGGVKAYQMYLVPLNPYKPAVATSAPTDKQTPQVNPVGPDTIVNGVPLGGPSASQELAAELTKFAQSLQIMPETEKDATEMLDEATDSADANVSSASGDVAASPPAIMHPIVVWKNRHSDPLWNLFLSKEIFRQIEANQADKALALTHAIEDEEEKWLAQLLVADLFHRHSDLAQRNKLFDDLEVSAVSASNLPKRILGLTLLSQRLLAYGEVKRAGEVERKAEKLTTDLSFGGSNALALAQLARHYASIGNSEKAQRTWRDANRSINLSPDVEVRLRTSIQVADTYSQSGSRNEAIGILVACLELARRLPDASKRTDLYKEIARAYALANDVKSVITVAYRLRSKDERDQTILDGIGIELSKNEPYLALRLVDILQLAPYQTLGQAAAGWVMKKDARLSALGEQYMNRARKTFMEASAAPSDQAIVWARLSRYLAWTAEEKIRTEDLAASAIRASTLMPLGTFRDTTLAIVALDLGRGQMISFAQEALRGIAEPGLNQATTAELEQVINIPENLQ